MVKLTAVFFLTTAIVASLGASPEDKFVVDDIVNVPPYSTDGENVQHNTAFEAKCADKARMLSVAHGANIEIGRAKITDNQTFGLVWRADFNVPNGSQQAINRLIMWQLPNGEIAKFIAMNISSPPLR